MAILWETGSEYGQRVERRLAQDAVLWLTTVSGAQQPCPRPVWFWWDGNAFLIYSMPETAKVAHIRGNPLVALHFDGDEMGNNVVVFNGRAEIMDKSPDSDDTLAYLEKYEAGLRHINMTAEQFTSVFSAAIRITPTKLRGH